VTLATSALLLLDQFLTARALRISTRAAFTRVLLARLSLVIRTVPPVVRVAARAKLVLLGTLFHQGAALLAPLAIMRKWAVVQRFVWLAVFRSAVHAAAGLFVRRAIRGTALLLEAAAL